MVRNNNKKVFAQISFLTKNNIKLLVFKIVDILLFFRRSRIEPNTLLLIRVDRIGDFILWLDTAKEYKKHYPNYKIILIANELWANLAIELPYWDQIISINVNRISKNIIYRYQTLLKIKRLSTEITIQPTFSRVFLTGDSIVKTMDSKKKIGSIGDLDNLTSFQKRISDKWYTQLIKATDKPLMELQRNAEFISNLFDIDILPNLPVLTSIINLPSKFLFAEKYYILVPGASASKKQWDIKSFSLLANYIYNSHRLIGIIVGANSEKSICEEVINNSTAKLMNLAGKTTLSELVEIIRNASFIVGNDTAAIHIAASVNTRSLCILSGAHYGRFLPYNINHNTIYKHNIPIVINRKMDCYGCGWKCVYKYPPNSPVPCVQRVKVVDVYSKIDELLLMKN